MDYLKKTRLLGVLGSILVIIAVFLPVATVSSSWVGVSESQGFISDGRGVATLILAIVNLVLMFSGFIAKMSKVKFFETLTEPKISLIPAGVIAILLITFGCDVMSAGSMTFGLAKVSLSIGYWLMWIGTAACLVYPFICKGKTAPALPMAAMDNMKKVADKAKTATTKSKENTEKKEK